MLDDVSVFYSSCYYSRISVRSISFSVKKRKTHSHWLSRFSVQLDWLDLVTVGLVERQDNRRHRDGKPHKMKLNQISDALPAQLRTVVLLIHIHPPRCIPSTAHILVHPFSIDFKIEFGRRANCAVAVVDAIRWYKEMERKQDNDWWWSGCWSTTERAKINCAREEKLCAQVDWGRKMKTGDAMRDRNKKKKFSSARK